MSVGELAASMEANGLIQPVILSPYASAWPGDPHWLCIAGHRRIAAARLLNWLEIAAVCKSYKMGLVDAKRENLVENMARKDLTPTQEMRAIVAIYGEAPDASQVASASLRICVERITVFSRPIRRIISRISTI